MWKIILQQGQKVYFTSDTHYNHTNICSGVTKWKGNMDLTRKYDSLDEMNQAIVDGINENVGQNDILIHMGDWSFGGFDSIKQFRDRIVCKNVYLVFGNHDHHIENNRDGCQGLFVKTSHYQRLTVVDGKDEYKFILFHFPICSWDNMNKDRIHLFGHIHLHGHQALMPGRAMDVGIDGNNMEPYEMYQILNIMNNRKVKTTVLPLDHHETEIR